MKQVYFVLTKKCNLSCNYCIRDYTVKNSNLLNIETVKFVFNEISETFPSSKIILTGGEPTLLSNFHDIFCLSKNYFSNRIMINSNGVTNYFFSEQFLNLNNKNDFVVQISIDGYEDLHDSVRGQGAFNKSIETIKYLTTKLHVKTVISTTVFSMQFLDEFQKLQNKLIEMPIFRWDIKRVSYSGRANDYSYLETDSWNRIVDFVNQNTLSDNIRICKQFDFSFLDNLTDFELDTIKTIKNCGSGTEKIYIYPNLDVLACTCYEKLPSGNLKDSKLAEILNSETHQSITNNVIDNHICNACRYKKLCNGGCLGSGFSLTNKLGLADMKCPKVRSEFL